MTTKTKTRLAVCVRFRAKAKSRQIYSDEPPRNYVPVKQGIGRDDIVDAQTFRDHPQTSGLANSDLANGLISGRLRHVLGRANSHWLCLENLPVGVTIDASGFLATVTIELWPAE